jgi:predicted AlkP superfamily phosphohydrolase/phosphomutase
MNMRQRPETQLWCWALITIAALASGCAQPGQTQTPPKKRVIVLGIDGMDPQFVGKHWGDLPNLMRLRQEGDFRALGTTTPPQSPVAWSTFITGMDPGGHGIYDFIHRDPKTMMPFSSMSQSTEGGFSLPIGPYVLPLSSGRVVSLRQGKPFWQMLSERGVPVSIIRMPTNFPPVHCDDGVSVAGMGTPDLRGTFGTFTFFTSDPKENTRKVPGGEIVRTDVHNYTAQLEVQGPANSLRKDRALTSISLTMHIDPDHPVARFEVGDRQIILKQGEWSGWVPVNFPLLAMKSVAGMIRIYAKRVSPTVEVYISPVNIDPSNAAMPVTAPESYSRELAAAVGPFYTQGMAQDTAALRKGVLSRSEYRAQSREVSLDHLKLLRYGLERFQEGLLFFHFFGVDQDAHMLWGKFDDELLETYRMVDETIGWVKQMAPDATLIVMSDHGFASFDRAVHMNAWLMEEGFLTLDDPKNAGDEELFAHVDWSRTKAYSVGLNGIYLNLRNRERDGIVEPGEEASAVIQKIAGRLAQFRDPQTGERVVADVAIAAKHFHGPMLTSAPDIVIGYNSGYRSSWQTALGAVPGHQLDDNRDEWRGDHCVASHLVPGVLIVNRKIIAEKPQLHDLTVTVLNEFGVGPGAGMSGRVAF